MSLSPAVWASIFTPIFVSLLAPILIKLLKKPKVRISRILTKKNWYEINNESPRIVLEILFRNSGEKNTDFSIMAILEVIDKIGNEYLSKNILYNTSIEAEKSIQKDFNFLMPTEAKNWNLGILKISGYYLGKKDKRKKIKESFGSFGSGTFEWGKVKRVRFFHFFFLRMKSFFNRLER